MHNFSKDFGFEPTVHVVIAFISFFVSQVLNPYLHKFADYLLLAQQIHVALNISVFAIFAVLEWLFQAYLWRVLAALKVPGVINLNGEWSGNLLIADLPTSYPATLKIEQKWSKMSIEFSSSDAEGVSFGAAFMHGREKKGKVELLYNYHAKARKSGKASQHFDHFGTSILALSSDQKSLKGTYFTEPLRNSHGEVNLTQIS